MSTDVIKTQGVITEIHQGGLFSLNIEIGSPPQVKEVRAKCSGKMRRFQIRIVKGDTVDIEFSPYDLTLGRITHRYK